jgi:hypothetical protein
MIKTTQSQLAKMMRHCPNADELADSLELELIDDDDDDDEITQTTLKGI